MTVVAETAVVVVAAVRNERAGEVDRLRLPVEQFSPSGPSGDELRLNGATAGDREVGVCEGWL